MKEITHYFVFNDHCKRVYAGMNKEQDFRVIQNSSNSLSQKQKGKKCIQSCALEDKC